MLDSADLKQVLLFEISLVVFYLLLKVKLTFKILHFKKINFEIRL